MHSKISTKANAGLVPEMRRPEQVDSRELSEDVNIIKIMHLQHIPYENAELQPASLW